MAVAGTAAGPLLLAWGADALGGYVPSLWALLPLPATLALACAIALRPPRAPPPAGTAGRGLGATGNR